jgi:nitrogen-specific signal transduction histidine kinase
MTPEAVALLEALPAGIVLVDAEDRIRTANGAAANLLGCGAAELLGRILEEVLAERAGRTPLHVRRCPYSDGAGTVAVAVLESAVPSAAAEFASAVKHDVNNLLMGLLGQAALLATRPELSETSRQKVALIERQGIRIRDRIASLDALKK